MLKAKIGTIEMEYLDAIETEEYYNGANRRTLTITAAADAVGVDELHAALTESNLASVTLSNTDPEVSNVYDGYVLPLACGMQSVQTSEETPEIPAKYEQRLVLKLGKRTYIEEQLRRLGLG